MRRLGLFIIQLKKGYKHRLGVPSFISSGGGYDVNCTRFFPFVKGNLHTEMIYSKTPYDKKHVFEGRPPGHDLKTGPKEWTIVECDVGYGEEIFVFARNALDVMRCNLHSKPMLQHCQWIVNMSFVTDSLQN